MSFSIQVAEGAAASALEESGGCLKSFQKPRYTTILAASASKSIHHSNSASHNCPNFWGEMPVWVFVHFALGHAQIALGHNTVAVASSILGSLDDRVMMM